MTSSPDDRPAISNLAREERRFPPSPEFVAQANVTEEI